MSVRNQATLSPGSWFLAAPRRKGTDILLLYKEVIHNFFFPFVDYCSWVKDATDHVKRLGLERGGYWQNKCPGRSSTEKWYLSKCPTPDFYSFQKKTGNHRVSYPQPYIYAPITKHIRENTLCQDLTCC